MKENQFILNHRFYIDASLGLIKDSGAEKETRLEPRLMSLLCLLVAHKGKLVSRELITKEIWKDYGNADEGLTQAISYLRKVMADDKKELIETIPKKGYILHATITDPTKQTGTQMDRTKFRYLLVTSVFCVLLIVAYFIFKSKSQEESINPDALSTDIQPNNPDALSDSSKTKRLNALQDSSGSESADTRK